MPPTIPFSRAERSEPDFTLRKDQTCPTVEGIGTERLLSESFDRSGVTALRHAVTSCAESAGLADGRLEDFVVAVNELLTNAVRHGGGSGRIELWRENSSVVCEVTDPGTGLADPRPGPPHRGRTGRLGALAGRRTDRHDRYPDRRGRDLCAHLHPQFLKIL